MERSPGGASAAIALRWWRCRRGFKPGTPFSINIVALAMYLRLLRCVDGAPLNSEETGPDISRADFVFCMTAITWVGSGNHTTHRLMEKWIKAQANGKGYVELTVCNAAPVVDRLRDQPTQHRTAEHGRG